MDASRPPATGVTAVILCGGAASRFGGVDKALVELGGRALLARVVAAARPLASEVLLATGSGPRHASLGLPIVLDPAPPAGRSAGAALGGILAGLEAARHEVVLLLAVDQPLLTTAALDRLIAALGPADASGFDLAVPESDGRLHPLCVAARRDPLLAAARQLWLSPNPAPRRLAELVRTRRILVGPPESGDPLARAVLNVNTAEDLARADALLSPE